MMNRAGFLQSLAGSLAIALIDRSPLSALPVYGRSLTHPDPRPGITSEHVLAAADLGKSAEKKTVMSAYDNARAHPEIFDGLGCGCGCTGAGAEHRSLLSCYESMQPTGCIACQEESAFVGGLANDGKTLAEIRTAVDKKFG